MIFIHKGAKNELFPTQAYANISKLKKSTVLVYIFHVEENSPYFRNLLKFTSLLGRVSVIHY